MSHVGPLHGINSEALEGVAQNVFVRQEALEFAQNLVGGLDKEGTGQRMVRADGNVEARSIAINYAGNQLLAVSQGYNGWGIDDEANAGVVVVLLLAASLRLWQCCLPDMGQGQNLSQRVCP